MRLGRNIFWNLVSFLWLAVVIVAATPYIVRTLGLEAYGVWVVIMATTGYLSLFDLGMGNALIRFLAAEVERDDRRSLEAYARTGSSLLLGLGILCTLPMLLGASVVFQRWIEVPEPLVGEAVLSFRISSAAVLLAFLSAPYTAVPAAVQRFDILSLRSFLFFTLQFGLMVLVLMAGGGLREVALVYVAVAGVFFVFMFLVARRLLPTVRIRPGWNRVAVGTLLRFGRAKFPAQLAATLLQQFDRVALAALLPLGEVAFYAVPQRVSLRLGQMAEQIGAPFYPAVTAHLAGNRLRDLERHYRLGTRLIALALFGAVAVLGGLADPVLKVWMGQDFAVAGTTSFRLLLLAYGASSLFILPSVAADAAARPGIPSFFLVIGSAVHVVFILLAVPHWGLAGAAAGVLLGFLIPLLLGVPIIHRAVPSLPSLRSVLRELRGTTAAFVLTALAAFLLSLRDYPGSGAIPLLASLSACVLLYGLLLWLFRSLRREDVVGFVGMLRSLDGRGG